MLTGSWSLVQSNITSYYIPVIFPMEHLICIEYQNYDICNDKHNTRSAKQVQCLIPLDALLIHHRLRCDTVILNKI